MEANDQNGSCSSKKIAMLDDLGNIPKNQTGLTILEEKVQYLIKNLTLPKNLYNLKLLFEDSQNEFSPQILINSLVTLSDPNPFNFYSKDSVARLELHIRTWVIVLERICFYPIRLSRELRENVYNSLAKFAEIHRKTTQVVEDGLENVFKPKSNQFSQQKYLDQNENTVRKRNYNIDFLLIHLRDTLHSLRDDETWFQELIRRVKDILKAAIGVTPGILSKVASGVPCPNDSSSILTMVTQLRQGLCFKHPIARYYFDWRTLLIIQHDIDKIISKKFGEKIIMEYLWNYLEEEQNSVDQTFLDSQIKFDEISSKIFKALKITGGLLNDLAGNEPLALPHTLWFGILDLAHNLIKKSNQTGTHGLCYYLAIKSFHDSPSSFIQFKAIEILIHLYNINNEIFSIIEADFDQYSQNLSENASTDSLERFKSLLKFTKEKFKEDLKIINDDIGKGKGKVKLKSSDQSVYLKDEHISNSSNVLDVIADEMTCSIGHEPTNQICVLKCQHILSLSNFNKLKQSKCPECREIIKDNEVRYLSQNAIYRNLYPHFHEAGYNLTSMETENLETHNCDSSDSSDSDDFILAKKANINKIFKISTNISLRSIFQIRLSKKQYPAYQNAMKELTEKSYEKAEYWCKEFLKDFPKSYSMRCILAYTYRILNNYEQACFYLNEAINLNERNLIAWCIRGEIHYRQKNYDDVINDLNSLIKIDKTKIKNLNIILGNSYLFQGIKDQERGYNSIYNYNYALESFNIALKHDPYNYLCLKHSAFIYEEQENFSSALEMLSILLKISYQDSLILCYYGEILVKLGIYDEAIKYFTNALKIDPENVHILNKNRLYSNELKNYMTNYNLDTITLSLFIKCKLSIEKEDYDKALLLFNELWEMSEENIFVIKVFRQYNKFWVYLYNHYYKPNLLSTYLLADSFKNFLFEEKRICFLSNYKHSIISEDGLSGYILNGKDIKTFTLPKIITAIWENSQYYVIWRLCINEVFEFCYVNFGMVTGDKAYIWSDNEHTLKYEDLKKLVGLGWIEYTLPFVIENDTSIDYFEPSIEINNSSNDILVDYFRFTKFKRETIRLSHMVDSLPKYDSELSIPKVFNDKYFTSEVENLIELKDLIT
ncbi:2158_t:CDS:2 [Funneliformis geosporum]|uniref:2158_t:CDS:1 n=1 Tax=Funneliformis geosporum TaxID=1117311 RepID=A0A9W4WQZ6_9GLOM|nr:2158_t:CDS:2 [Funneliformis geosporum]